MNEFFENPDLAAIDYAENSSDSEPEAGEVPMENRKKAFANIHRLPRNNKTPVDQKKIISTQSISNRTTSLSIGSKYEGKSKTDQSIKMKIDNIEEQKLHELDSERGRKTSERKTHAMSKITNNYYVRTDIINKNINDKLNLIDNSHRFRSSDIKMTEEV